MQKNNVGKPSLLGMIWNPIEQFERIRVQPRIWGAFAIISIIYLIGSIMLAQTITAEDLVVPGAVPLSEAELILGFSRITAVISGFIAPIFVILIYSAIQLIIVKLAKKDTSFKQLFSMNTHIMFIGAIGLILNTSFQLLFGGTTGVNITSLGGVIGSDSPVLAVFEVFSIWQIVLTGIGLHKVGGLSKGAAWTLAIVFFLIGLSFGLIGAAIEGIFGV